MFFGSYLLREKVISYKDYIDCIAEQTKSSPSLVEVLYQSEKISETQMVELIDFQFEADGKNLKEVIIERNILNNSELNEIIRSGLDTQSSFSDILVSKDLVSIEELKKHYSNYEKMPKEQSSNQEDQDVEISSAALESLKELNGVDLSEFEEVSESTSDEASTESGPELSPAALESLKELDPSAVEGLEIKNEEVSTDISSPNDTFKKEFIETFNEKMHSKINKIVVIIHKTAQENGDFSNFFNSLFREFHVIKGAARLAGYKMFEDLIDQFEDVLDNFFKLDEGTKKEWLVIKGDILNSFINSCWEIRNSLSETGNEDEVDYGESRSFVNNLGSLQLAS